MRMILHLLRTFFMHLSNHHEKIIPIAYVISVIALTISARTACITCSVLIVIFICSLFMIETLFLFQKYKNVNFDTLLKIWKYGKYLVMSFIAILAMGNTNEFIYLQLRENPNNYPLAVTALISVFTIVNITVIFSWIFFIAAILFTWSGATIFTRLGRSIALFIFISIYIINFYDITNKVGKKVIMTTSFYPNLQCSNPALLNQKIALTSNNDIVLTYNEKSNLFEHVKCHIFDFRSNHIVPSGK